jgi:predicted translin family RNA/ssDNA-binding protein
LAYSHEGKVWIVDCPELNLYGEGVDEIQAANDFKTTLEEFYFSLKKDKEKLGSELKKKWDILQKIIEEK